MTKLRELFGLIHLHPILIFFSIIGVLTGTFMQLFIIFCIIFWHEMGHYVAARYYNWRITEIMFWVFGGVMKTEEHGNQPIKQAFIVTIFGPMQHVFIYLFLMLCDMYNVLPDSVLKLGFYYNSIIFIFNLLPIYPLDGGKLFFYLLSIFNPYRKAYHIILYYSLLMCVSIILLQLLFMSFTLSATLLMACLFLENRLEWKHRSYAFIRFLLYRCTTDQKYKKIKKVSVSPEIEHMDLFALFYRNKYHEIHIKSHPKFIVTETLCLERYFNQHQYNESLHQWMKSVKIKQHKKINHFKEDLS